MLRPSLVAKVKRETVWVCGVTIRTLVRSRARFILGPQIERGVGGYSSKMRTGTFRNTVLNE